MTEDAFGGGLRDFVFLSSNFFSTIPLKKWSVLRSGCDSRSKSSDVK